MSTQTLKYFQSTILNSKELTKKEKDVLIRRLINKPLKKIGRRYHLTGERIRQIENSALAKFFKKVCQLILLD